MTFIERIQECIEVARIEQKTNCAPAAAREYALAITALEDAGMRFNRGMAIKGHMFSQADVEAILDGSQYAVEVDPNQLTLDGVGETKE